MHSSLDKPHPECHEIVEALQICHEENPFMKFTGTCNDIKVALNDCFMKENLHRRKANLVKAKQFDKKWKEHKEKQATSA